MSETITGRIKVKSIKGQRVAILIPMAGVDNKKCWYSTFINERTPQEVKDVLQNLKEGDEVELSYATNEAGFKNIKGIVPVVQTKEELPPELEPEPKPKARESNRGDNTVNRSISLRYATDAWIAGKVADKREMFLLAEENVMFMSGPITEPQSDENGN